MNKEDLDQTVLNAAVEYLQYSKKPSISIQKKGMDIGIRYDRPGVNSAISAYDAQPKTIARTRKHQTDVLKAAQALLRHTAAHFMQVKGHGIVVTMTFQAEPINQEGY